jgi:hypothetical protein
MTYRASVLRLPPPCEVQRLDYRRVLPCRAHRHRRALSFGFPGVALCHAVLKQKGRPFGGALPAYLATAFRLAGVLVFVGVFACAALATALRFAGVLVLVGIFACAARAAAFRFAGFLLFAGVFAGFFVVFVIVITLDFVT